MFCSTFFVFSLCLMGLLVDLPTATIQYAAAEILGQCPRTTGFGVCVEACSSDADCQPGQRCCSNGCGHTCQNTRGVEKPVKPGQCPPIPPDTAGLCVEACQSDAGCPAGEKCCSNGCGHTCQTPGSRLEKTVKPGQCPPVLPGTVGICVERCQSDAFCPAGEKCCSNGCGHTCQTPAASGTTSPPPAASPSSSKRTIGIAGCLSVGGVVLVVVRFLQQF